MKLHFVGIGGIGMSGIAEVLMNQGYQISGSDLSQNEMTQRLSKLGAKIYLGHHAENVHGVQVVVISSAVKPNNPEVIEAKKLRIPVIPRAEMLGELMRGKTGVSVAGTHGKTTTTSMLATVLSHAGLDPTLVIGGRVDSLGGNAKLGQGKIVVAEADESDGSFLHLPATFAVITNIDNDHLDHFGSLKGLEDAFVEFAGKIPFYGCVALCIDDEGVKRCLSRLTKPYVTYGFGKDAEYRVHSVESLGFGNRFVIENQRLDLSVSIHLNVPGLHNVLNAAGAFAIAHRMEVKPTVIAAGLSEFQGVKRRFEVRWKDEKTKRLIVDDYGHHPTEIAATLAAAKQYWRGRVVCIFQPHRYSRTLHCKEGFYTAFRDADVVFLTDIYSAGEEPIEGVTGPWFFELMKKQSLTLQDFEYVPNLPEATQAILEKFKPGDLLLCMGAGTITRLPEMLIAELEK